MWNLPTAAEHTRQLRSIVRGETIRLLVLSSCAAAAFLGTRLLAQRAEHLERSDAAAWYARGQQLLSSQPNRAAVVFRRAVMKDRTEARYALALADALARAGNPESAERALQGLRESSPEDVDVNLALARLHRDDANLATARRFYHHAIYAPGITLDRARAIRLELVRMLLAHGDEARAQAELIAATVDMPDLRDLRMELARLFERAGDVARAAEQYRRVLSSEPQDVTALEGAVRTGFSLGNYRDVLTYRLPASAHEEARELRAIAREVVSRDPLAARLSPRLRRERLLMNLRYIEQRWKACSSSRQAAADFPATLTAVRRRARAATIGRDTQAIEETLAAIDALRASVDSICAQPTAADRAIEIIARVHRVHEP